MWSTFILINEESVNRSLYLFWKSYIYLSWTLILILVKIAQKNHEFYLFHLFIHYYSLIYLLFIFIGIYSIIFYIIYN